MSKEEKYNEENEEQNQQAPDANRQEEQAAEEQPAAQEGDAEKSEAQIIAEQEQALADLKDKYLRQVAEFDNYRKRTIKEKAELIKNGGERVIEAILPVLDDFERALQNLGKEECNKELREGVELIYHKFESTLKQQGLQKIETEGADFDTDYHEAIALVPAPDEKLKGKVLDCVQTGYTLNDKVIRHAKVAVGQ